MVVPYGDPDAVWSWRGAFDVGEYGVGRLSSQLVPGVDVPENARFFAAVFANDRGEPYTQERSAALYERDGGMLWRHWDFEKDRTEARRGRELVLSYIATVGNYDYALSWTFRQDGTLRAAVDLTGILLPKGVDSSTCASCAGGQAPEADRYGALVAEHIVAVNHQHFFCFRLDFDVGGPPNAVSELEVRSAAAAAHPAGNAFVVDEKRIASERESGRDLDLATARKWKVFHASARNALGHRLGYLLVPEENSVPYNRPDSPIRRRSRFTEHHLWVTRYHPDEVYAAGAYPNQQEIDTGLPVWTADGEPLDGEDVVLWYTMGITHTPRAEEWPVMPVHHAGFTLMPHGFFTRNPALDVP
jgi:primary-amine oxidase